MQKGLRRELHDSDFQDAEETATRETETGDKTESEARGPGEIHGGISSATLRERILSNRVLLPLLPSTLGKKLRSQPTRHRL